MQYSILLSSAVIVSSLGYFVDIYDLILFSIVRTSSLQALGVPPDAILSFGVLLLNMQMAGMLLGGIIWGILGDKKGRISVLLGSILLYSIANLANAAVQDVYTYALLRLLAGIGLAGELGAAITLVSESLPKYMRGYGTTMVAGIGVTGAVAAVLIAETLNWRMAYAVGGCMGLSLLLIRVSMRESSLFTQTQQLQVKRGNFFSLFTSWSRFGRYTACIVTGLPIWFVIGILITFSPEFAKELHVTQPILAASAVLACYIGTALGDVLSGLLSQWAKSRRLILCSFIVATALLSYIYLNTYHMTPFTFYTLCLLLGISTGYWAVFVTAAAEQFGTNLRATVTTTTPNFVRGSVVVLTISVQSLLRYTTLSNSALIVGGSTMILAFIAAFLQQETFHRDLDFTE